MIAAAGTIFALSSLIQMHSRWAFRLKQFACPNCGERTHEKARFCESCGETLLHPTRESQFGRERTVVACGDCGWKVARTPNADDCVGKEVGRCQRCKGITRIEEIHDALERSNQIVDNKRRKTIDEEEVQPY
jgi:hypothetical protein